MFKISWGNKWIIVSLARVIIGKILKVFVWRPLLNFENDFIHSPTGLLKLAETWAKESKYHKYFQIVDPQHGYSVLRNISKVKKARIPFWVFKDFSLPTTSRSWGVH